MTRLPHWLEIVLHAEVVVVTIFFAVALPISVGMIAWELWKDFKRSRE
jgi:hypothetical protein